MGELGKLHDAMKKHVDGGIVPGVVTLVSRRGEVDAFVAGALAEGGGAGPMRRDTLFRISSMTKPIAAAAAMTLVDDGKVRLDDPVDALLPELANRRVLRRVDGPLDDTVPAKRAITLRDVLTYTMGFGMLWGPPDAHPIQRAEKELALGTFGPPKPQLAPPPDEWIRRFATLPLVHQPGERWMYNTSGEVLGVYLARAAGKPVDAVLRERIFEPLGMSDTAFTVPAEKIDRLATSYMAKDAFRPDVAGSTVYDAAAGGDWSHPPAFLSCAAGLVSTADDCLAFGTMLLDRGVWKGRRILSEASVDAMTRDHLTAEQKAQSPFHPPDYWSTHGWGFGMAIVTAPDDITGTAGRYGWDGGLGTSWASDPQRGIVGVLMTQRAAFPPLSGVYRDFWRELYRVDRA
jgi:CubicO group peptidase (beta-lactamase class C family)